MKRRPVGPLEHDIVCRWCRRYSGASAMTYRKWVKRKISKRERREGKTEARKEADG